MEMTMKKLIGFILIAAIFAIAACTSAPATTGAAVRGSGYNYEQAGAKIIDVALVTDTGLAGTKAAAIKPGYAFTITSASSFEHSKSGTVTAKVKIDTVTVDSLTFGADSLRAGALIPNNVSGDSTQTIYVLLTTTGAGILHQGHVVIGLKPSYK
jgi:hypothetical protein